MTYRYKQHLARAVKNELQLDSTPSADMGEYAEETPKVEAPVVEQPKPAPVVSSPVRIGGGEAPAKPQPKGNLVVNASMLQTPKATTVSLFCCLFILANLHFGWCERGET